MKLTQAEKDALVGFFDELEEHMGNAGCNDYILNNTPENKKFLIDVVKRCSDNEVKQKEIEEIKEKNSKTLCFTDFEVFSYLRNKIEKILGIKKK